MADQSLRLSEEPEEFKEPTEVELQEAEHDTKSVSVELADGSVIIDLDPKPEPQGPTAHDDNLAEKIEESELNRISEDLLQGIYDDDMSRKEWLSTRAVGIDLLGLKLENPKSDIGGSSSAPLEGMSTVRSPLLLESVLNFQATARGELLPSDGPVKVRDEGDETEQKDELAEALEDDMNYYLTVVAREYYPDTDRLLFLTGFSGCGFKKVYRCPIRRRPVSESVDAEDLIVSDAATDLQNCGRVTHRIMMRPSVMKRMQLSGAYRDIALSTPAFAEPNEVDQKKLEIQGINPQQTREQDRDREVYECCCELDIKGFEHKEDGEATGLPLPYIVTIDKDSRQILQIRRNWREDDEDYVAKTLFVKYPFVPGLGFYDIGLLQILGNSTSAVTAAWRLMLDAGMFANFPGFLFAKGAGRQATNEFRIPPGGGRPIDTGDKPINQAVMPLPYKEPGQALMNLTKEIQDATQRVGGAATQKVGEGKQDAPVGTTIALIEQATKIVDAVHKRIHAAQAEEFQLLKELFRDDPESFIRIKNKKRKRNKGFVWDSQKFIAALDNEDIVPAADPNTPSHMHRILKAVALKELQKMNPQLYDAKKVDSRILKMIGVSNPDSLYAPPQEEPGPDPLAMGELQVKQAANWLKLMKMISDAKEKKADRRSKEDLALLELATTLAVHPESEEVVDRTLNISMGKNGAANGNSSPQPQ